MNCREEEERIVSIAQGPEKVGSTFRHLVDLRNREKPEVQSLSSIWKTADWHEREAYDFFGIQFLGHPNLTRILLPADWEGHPLRKDYVEQERYRGIKVKYEG